MDVLQQIDDRLQSPFSIHKWIASKSWGTLVKEIRLLPAVGVYSLPIAARLDKAAYDIYGNAILDWVLLVYNKIGTMGTFEGRDEQETFVLTIDGNGERTEDLQLTTTNFELYIWNAVTNTWQRNNTKTTSTEGFQFDLNNDGINDMVVDTTKASPVFKNIGNEEVTFQVVRTRKTYEDYLDAGEDITYPDLTALVRLFASGVVESADKNNYYGFKRL